MKERTATDLPARPLRHSRRNTLKKTRCKLCRMEILGVGADRQGSLQRLVLPVSIDRVSNHGLGSAVLGRDMDWMVRSFADRISAGESVRGQGISRMTDGFSLSAELRERTGTGRDVFRCRREDVLCRDGVSKGTQRRLLVVLAYLGVQLDGIRAREDGIRGATNPSDPVPTERALDNAESALTRPVSSGKLVVALGSYHN